MKLKLSNYGIKFSTRQRAHEVFDALLKDINNIEISFKDVVTVTPSFLHEMITIFENEKVSYDIIEMSKTTNFQLTKAKLALQDFTPGTN